MCGSFIKDVAGSTEVFLNFFFFKHRRLRASFSVEKSACSLCFLGSDGTHPKARRYLKFALNVGTGPP